MSWEHPLSKLDLCFSGSTGLYWCSGLWRFSWLVRGISSEWVMALKTTSLWVTVTSYLFIYLFTYEAVQSELLSGHICPFKLYSISYQLCHKPGYFWSNTESCVSLWYKLSHNWNLWLCHFSELWPAFTLWHQAGWVLSSVIIFLLPNSLSSKPSSTISRIHRSPSCLSWWTGMWGGTLWELPIRKHSAMRCFRERLLGDRSCTSVVLLGEL